MDKETHVFLFLTTTTKYSTLIFAAVIFIIIILYTIFGLTFDNS